MSQQNPVFVTTPRNTQPPRQARRWLLLLLGCLIVVSMLGGLKFLQIKQAIAFAESFPERSESVTAVLAQPSSMQKTYRTIGEIQATQSIELRNEVDGKIDQIHFTGGDLVTKGQLLLQLDSDQERAQLRATQAQLKLANLQLQRVSELRKKNLTSINELDIAKADKDVLVANAAALAATIDKKSLRAPFAAETGLHNLQVGQYLVANSLITRLSGVSAQYWVDFELPQSHAHLSAGDSVQVSDQYLMQQAVAATIISAEPGIDTTSRSRGYRAVINYLEGLRPGTVVNVEVVADTIDGVFRLPASAVRRSSFGAFVYTLQASEAGAAAPFRAKQQQVSVSGAEADVVYVSGGLQAGEQVATIGAFKLQDGMLVHIVEPSIASQNEQVQATN